MNRKAPLWIPAGLRCKGVRGFSDSFSRLDFSHQAA